MKDKTHAMNMGLSSEYAERGYGDPGSPTTRKQYKARQQNVAGLLDNQGLRNIENPDGDDSNSNKPAGFVPRSNYSDRF